MSGCKSKSKALFHNPHHADVVQDSSTEERSARSMGDRSTWIPAYPTTITSTLNASRNTLRTSYFSTTELWRLGMGGGTWEGWQRCMARYEKVLAHFHSNRQSITCTM